MAQHDMVLDNSPGAAARSDINAALLALATNSAGASEPPVKYPFMWWPDISTDMMKQRNANNTGWIDVFRISSGLSPLLASNTILGGIAAGTSGTSFKNILLNPRISAGINQRGVANWAAVAIGAYGYDRWKKVDASTITQIVEAGNYTPSTVYTLSGNATATQQVTSPASGHWTIPAISNLETDVQLEEGYIASKRERRPKEMELILCQNYCRVIVGTSFFASGTVRTGGTSGFCVCPIAMGMRSTPSIGISGAFPVAYVGDANAVLTNLTLSKTGNATYATGLAVGTVGQGCCLFANSAITLSSEL